MYGDMWPSAGCLIAVAVLAVIGLIAVIAGAWWFFSQISIVWGGQ